MSWEIPDRCGVPCVYCDVIGQQGGVGLRDFTAVATGAIAAQVDTTPAAPVQVDGNSEVFVLRTGFPCRQILGDENVYILTVDCDAFTSLQVAAKRLCLINSFLNAVKYA